MSTVLCSTGAIIGRPNNRDYRLLEPLSKQLTCDGFEFMIYSSWYEEIEKLISTVKTMKLNIPVVHFEKGIGECISKGEFEEAYRRFELNCKISEEFGAKKIVLHLWSGIASDGQFENNLGAYAKLREISDRYGLELLIENVVCNRENPMKHWCELREKYPDILFVYDTKMAAFHAQTELLYEKEYEWLQKENHLRHYHVNDYAGGYMDWTNLKVLPIGNGHVDFDRFFAYIREIGYDGSFTVESTAFDKNGVVDVEMLNRQFEYIRRVVQK